MVKKAAASAKNNKSPSKNGTPSKKAAPKRKTVTKPRGKAVKADFAEDPDMEKEDDEEPVKEEKKPVAKKTGKKVKALPVEETTLSDLISSDNIEKAITALSTYIENKPKDESKKQSLFDEDGHDYYLQITTTKFLASKPLSKPKSISIPHKLIDEEDFKICLFVKDNVIDSALLEQIEESNIPHLSKIISAKELKGEYKPFEAKRKLMSEYDLFLSDDFLIPTLPKLLGKVFYESSTKFPIPVKAYSQNKFSIKTLTNSINKVISSVTYIPPVGVNLSLKIGNSDFETPKLIENSQLIVKGLKLKDNNQIRTVQLKTLNSPSLPLYYIEKLYTEDDIEDETKKSEEKESSIKLDLSIEVPSGVKLTDFEKGLLELAADPEDVEKILSKKVKQAKKRKSNDEAVAAPVEQPKKKKGKK